MTKLLTALIALVIAAAIFIVYTRPAYTTAKAIQAEVSQYDAALDKSRELQELKRSLLARYNTFGTDQLARLSKLLPDHIDNVRLTLDLDSMAARHGMAIQNVTLNTPAKKTDDKKAPTILGTLGTKQREYDSLTLQFVTAGTYSDFVSFMNDLESSLRIVDIVALTIEPSGTGNQSTVSEEPFYRYSVSIRTYWLK